MPIFKMTVEVVTVYEITANYPTGLNAVTQIKQSSDELLRSMCSSRKRNVKITKAENLSIKQ